MYADAFAADPRLADNLRDRYLQRAAFAAALGAAGQGEDAAQLDDDAKAKLRGQALKWLTADLTALRTLLDSDPSQAWSFVADTLSLWHKHTSLASIRDKDALAKLPADEQSGFTRLWADVASLLKKANGPPSLAVLLQQLPEARKALPKESPQLAGLLAQIGMGLLEQKKWT